MSKSSLRWGQIKPSQPTRRAASGATSDRHTGAKSGCHSQLLADDIEDRRTRGGPHTRQARNDNAAFAEQAAKIPAAQKAEETARVLEAGQKALKIQRQRLREQLEAAPKRKLSQVESKHARREAMTPQQRAATERAPRVAKRRSITFDHDISSQPTQQPPTLGFNRDRDQGPEL